MASDDGVRERAQEACWSLLGAHTAAERCEDCVQFELILRAERAAVPRERAREFDAEFCDPYMDTARMLSILEQWAAEEEEKARG